MVADRSELVQERRRGFLKSWKIFMKLLCNVSDVLEAICLRRGRSRTSSTTAWKHWGLVVIVEVHHCNSLEIDLWTWNHHCHRLEFANCKRVQKERGENSIEIERKKYRRVVHFLKQ